MCLASRTHVGFYSCKYNYAYFNFKALSMNSFLFCYCLYVFINAAFSNQ